MIASDTRLLDLARWMVNERGLSVIALDHPSNTNQTDPKRIGKVPVTAWKAFQIGRATDSELQVWFGNGVRRNIGIVTGALSAVVAVDCDSPEALTWADAHLPPTPMTTRTCRGEHRFYRHPGVMLRNAVRIRTGVPVVRIDIRADGGYVVAPGSVHTSGFVYERVGEWPPVAKLPIFDPVWLTLHKPQRAKNLTRDLGRFDTAIQRARAYLAQTPGAIEGQGGDAHTFQVCCRLVHGFRLSDDDATALLAPWNASCVPPWSSDALRKKVENARKYGVESIAPTAGWRRPCSPGPPEVEQAADDKFSRASKAWAELFVTAAATCRDQRKVAMLLEPFVPAGAIGSLVAKVKMGKTTLLLDTVRCLRQARGFAGFAAPGVSQRILYATEQPHVSFAKQLRDAGLQDDEGLIVTYLSAWAGRPWWEIGPELVRYALSAAVTVIIIDTASRWFGFKGEEENHSGGAEHVQILQPFCTTGGTILLCRHARKSGGSLGDAGRGSSAIEGAVDFILHLSLSDQGADVRKLETAGRFEMPERLLLRRRRNEQVHQSQGIDGDGEVAEWFCFERVERLTSSEDLDRRVEAALSTGPRTQRELVIELARSGTSVGRALTRLERKGVVGAQGKAGRRNNARLYRLVRGQKTPPSKSLKDGGGEVERL
jgi:hypothetical protein